MYELLHYTLMRYDREVYMTYTFFEAVVGELTDFALGSGDYYINDSYLSSVMQFSTKTKSIEWFDSEKTKTITLTEHTEKAAKIIIQSADSVTLGNQRLEASGLYGSLRTLLDTHAIKKGQFSDSIHALKNGKHLSNNILGRIVALNITHKASISKNTQKYLKNTANIEGVGDSRHRRFITLEIPTAHISLGRGRGVMVTASQSYKVLLKRRYYNALIGVVDRKGGAIENNALDTNYHTLENNANASKIESKALGETMTALSDHAHNRLTRRFVSIEIHTERGAINKRYMTITRPSQKVRIVRKHRTIKKVRKADFSALLSFSSLDADLVK